ncbi:hypothetical protein AVEN_163554-1 [Araneus ventricosus]|uniref:Uncharacterized protein n=1 Tax=Araneus ventricosus TaxID=182803 RepID=A0A4Y2R3V6_ARAVE|nr:hypothetical protein AVEN_163554-1 [Araneus ventricosus]
MMERGRKGVAVLLGQRIIRERTDFIRPPHHLSSFNSVSSLFPDCGRLGERKKRTPVLFVGHDPEDEKRTLLVNGDVRH